MEIPNKANMVPMVITLCAACAAAPAPSVEHELRDRPLPEIERRAVDGSEVSTAALAGRVVVVKFFAEYCEPCRHTLPVSQAIHEKYRDVAVIGVSEDEYPSEAKRLAGAFGLAYPVIHDAGGVLAGRFRVGSMPVTFVADRRGNVVWIGGPDHEPADIERAVREALRRR
jgi:cytochrome c biogenesis protein CcmG/thiol:disulfide interchange protein DsbE